MGSHAIILPWLALFFLQSASSVLGGQPSHEATHDSLMRPEMSHAVQVREVPIGVSREQQASAGQLVEDTNSGGLVSKTRKIATVELAMKAAELEGDFVETGVYNGGTAVLMAKVMLSPGQASARRLWLADSFEGLPADVAVPTSSNGADIEGLNVRSHKFGKKGDYRSTRESFDLNLQKNGLLENERITVLQGWFSETLPKAAIQKIAFLRLDGDIFVSTRDSLEALYDKIVPGGYIYVDDYGSYAGCKEAVDEFRKEKGIASDMHSVREGEATDEFEALWWRKSVEPLLARRKLLRSS